MMPEEHLQDNGSRDRIQWSGGALDAFLPFMPVNERDAPAEKMASRLARGPVPVSLLVIIARRSGFPGLPVLEHAASLSDAAPNGGTLFDGGPSMERCGEEKETAEVHAGEGMPVGDRESVEAAFGRIASILGEERTGQVRMARAVYRALREEGVLLIEAGTGIGKSLAYLVPAMIVSREMGERVIISTHTRNLQYQLLAKELPLAEEVLRSGTRVAHLMGRENYICAKRLLSAVVGGMDDDPETALALGIAASLSGQGTVESLPAAVARHVRRRINAPSRCAMNACAHAAQCPLIGARKRARESAIVIVNHALLMTDYRQGGAILGPYRRIIFDEAHHVERCAMENLSVAVSREGIDLILDPVRPLPGGDERWRLLYRELEATVPGGDHVSAVADAMRGLRERYHELFGSIESGFERAGVSRQGRTRYIDGEATLPETRQPIKDYLLYYNKLRELLNPVLEANVHGDARSFQQEVTYALAEIAAISDAVPFILKADDEESVFWMEWSTDGRLRTICASPLSVDRLFADYIEEVCDTAIFTSATLAQNGDFTYQRACLGLAKLPGETDEMIVPSPFEFDKRCLILVNGGMGDPNREGYADLLADVLERLVREVNRRTMVLFTSYRLCRGTARNLAGRRFPGPILVQGEGMSREMLADRLRRSPAGLLLGVASFWEGVDFPGEELELLVIPKLPFPVPTEPIVEARSQRLRALGEDPFERLFLPEAIRKMRQGIGRLIRRRSDRGVVVILDSRIESRPYGEAILSSLPTAAVSAACAEELVAAARRWFSDERH